MIWNKIEDKKPAVGDRVIVHAKGYVDDIGVVEAPEEKDPENALLYVNCDGVFWGIHSDGKQTSGPDEYTKEVEMWIALPEVED